MSKYRGLRLRPVLHCLSGGLARPLIAHESDCCQKRRFRVFQCVHVWREGLYGKGSAIPCRLEARHLGHCTKAAIRIPQPVQQRIARYAGYMHHLCELCKNRRLAAHCVVERIVDQGKTSRPAEPVKRVGDVFLEPQARVCKAQGFDQPDNTKTHQNQLQLAIAL